MSELVRSWLPRAAALWVDMERGLYPWPGRAPRNADGSYRVVRKQILRDLGLSPDYRAQRERIWEHPAFLACLRKENWRRDTGIADAVAELQAVTGEGPLTRLDERLYELAMKDLDEDPEALSAKDKISLYLQTHRLRLEMEGKVSSVKEQGIGQLLAKLSRSEQITSTMVDRALELVGEYRELQDRKLAEAGIIEGTLEE